eukprot:3504810-Prymnesium_polylepis.1
MRGGSVRKARVGAVGCFSLACSKPRPRVAVARELPDAVMRGETAAVHTCEQYHHASGARS